MAVQKKVLIAFNEVWIRTKIQLKKCQVINNGENCMSGKKGFTLIELLVVIAIIALLLSIIMPGLRKAKVIAKSLVCKTNLKAIQMASGLYRDDHNGRIFAYDAYGNGGTLFINKMKPYIENVDKIRYCPETKVDEDAQDWPSFGDSHRAWRWGEEYGSYGINGFTYYDEFGQLVDPWYPNWDEIAYETLSQIRLPAIVPGFVDCVWVDRWPSHTDAIAGDHDLYDPYGSGTVISHMGLMMLDRHMGHGNVSFLDSHVEGVKLERFWTLKWSREFEIQGIQYRLDRTEIYR